MSMSTTAFEPLESIDDWEGLSSIKSLLNRISAGEDGAHAVLLFGAEGTGKSTAAMQLARTWLCPTPVENGACGECSICKASAGGRAVDLQVIRPWGAGRMIKLAAIHDVTPPDKEFEHIPIMEFFRTRPLMARSKVMVFEVAERMNLPAANALLKTLEEPPPYGKIILTTSEVGRVLPTIRSRCLCAACEAPPKPDSGQAAAEPWELALADTPGSLKRLREAPEPYKRLYSALERALTAELGSALSLASEARGAADELAKARGLKTRDAQVELVRAVGLWCLAKLPEKPAAAQAAAEAFRLIQGNSSPGLVFDAMFCRILG
jgi:DNA polymerase-3 subunit delta'